AESRQETARHGANHEDDRVREHGPVKDRVGEYAAVVRESDEGLLWVEEAPAPEARVGADQDGDNLERDQDRERGQDEHEHEALARAEPPSGALHARRAGAAAQVRAAISLVCLAPSSSVALMFSRGAIDLNFARGPMMNCVTLILPATLDCLGSLNFP